MGNMSCWPEVPPDAKQTNCWVFVLILETVGLIMNAISSFMQPNGVGTGIGYIIDVAIYWIIFYHVRYVHVEVTDSEINITMGPWQWPLLRWCCSSQIRKDEIVLVERKQRQCLYDVWPRLYCSPINWCCCHKSYSAYWWPCCCNDINCCNCCDGDSDSSDMVQFNLTQAANEFVPMCFKRCAPCPLACSWIWCCVYNRISVSIKSEQTWSELQQHGYPLSLLGSNEKTGLTGATPGTTEGTQQPV